MPIDPMLLQRCQVFNRPPSPLTTQAIKRPEQQNIKFALVGHQQDPTESMPLSGVLSARSNITNGFNDNPMLARGVFPQLTELVFEFLILGADTAVDENLSGGLGTVKSRGIFGGAHFIGELIDFWSLKYVSLGFV